ncbi:MAG: peroxiredoxin Q/BCP [Saprospiraceae bacterium]|jgi:peroxiredoxin Q/BCP
MIKIGDKAPSFSGEIQQGKTIDSNDFLGKKVILFFYPKDNTPGCTVEACDLRDNISLLKKEGFEVVGVSADSVERHNKFTDKFNLPFPLVADVQKEVINAYGIWGPKKFMGKEYEGIHRKTFVIDEKGYIEQIIEKVKTKAHAEQILATYK